MITCSWGTKPGYCYTVRLTGAYGLRNERGEGDVFSREKMVIGILLHQSSNDWRIFDINTLQCNQKEIDFASLPPISLL